MHIGSVLELQELSLDRKLLTGGMMPNKFTNLYLYEIGTNIDVPSLLVAKVVCKCPSKLVWEYP